MLLPECRTDILVTGHVAIIAGAGDGTTRMFLWWPGDLMADAVDGMFWDDVGSYLMPPRLWFPSPFSWFADPGVTTIDTEDVRRLGRLSDAALKANLIGGFPWAPFRAMALGLAGEWDALAGLLDCKFIARYP